MTQAEYNAKVQEMQQMWGDAAHILTNHRDGKLVSADFAVYWDGRLHNLGRQEKPFTPETTYSWNETLELELRGKFAAALIHS